MTRVLIGSQFYLHTQRSSAKGMNHTCLCLPSRRWYLFTDPGRMEGWVGLVVPLTICGTSPVTVMLGGRYDPSSVKRFS